MAPEPDPEPPATHGGRNARDLPDDALLAGYAQSDPATSTAFLARFQGRVYGLALSMLGDARAAEDIAQEAFLRAWRHASMFDARRGSVLTWLLTITRNAAIDSLRVRRPVAVDIAELVAAPPGAFPRDPADVAVLTDDSHRLRAALARLPESQRRAVVLAGMWGLSASEVADLEQIPLGTAKTRIRVALRRLRVAYARDTHPREDAYT
jgi:RNA polymerase sigma factor (sigma-70 family)